MWSILLYISCLYAALFMYFPLLRDLFASTSDPVMLSEEPQYEKEMAPLWTGYQQSPKSKVIPGKYIIHFKQAGTFNADNVASDAFSSLGILSVAEAQQVHRYWLLSEIASSNNPSNRVEHEYALGTSFSGYSGQFDTALLNKIRSSEIVDIVEPVQVVWAYDDLEDIVDLIEESFVFDAYKEKKVPVAPLGYMSAYDPSPNDRARYEILRQARRKVCADGDIASDTCIMQKDAPWGLERINRRANPSVYSGEYRHEEKSGMGVDVYVIDTGIHVNHIEFEGRARWGVTIPEGDEDRDGNGHGTHCAGTIGGRTYGVAKKCSLIAVKVLRSDGYGSNADVIKGIEYVMNQHLLEGKKRKDLQTVVNMSLGGGKSLALERAVNAAVKTGVHFCVAAGNENADACNSSPAGAKEAITVGASTRQDEVAFFSNIGRCVDIFAPGHQITSTWIGSSNNATNTISGTSMASPHVAGAVAHLLSGPLKGTDPADMKEKLRFMSTHNVLQFMPYDTTNALLHVHGCVPYSDDE